MNEDENAHVQIEGLLQANGILYSNLIKSVSNQHVDNILTYQTNKHSTKSKTTFIKQLHIEPPAGENSKFHLIHTNTMNGLENSITLSNDQLELKTSNFLVEAQRPLLGLGLNNNTRPIMKLNSHLLMIDGQLSHLRAPMGGLRISQQLNTSTIRASSKDVFR